MTHSLADVLSFWGKARPPRGHEVQYHPVAYHLLDVAAVADAILEARPLARARASWLLGLDPDIARRLLVTLTALHDLGKFAPGFQAKVPELWPPALGHFDPVKTRGGVHTDDGYRLWFHELAPTLGQQIWPDGGELLEALAPGIFGHHGRPTVTTALRDQPASWVFGPVASSIATACATEIVALLHPTAIDASGPSRRRASAASWWVAGLVTVADWIGSRQEWFPYVAPEPSDAGLETYWSRVRARARDVVREQGLAAPRIAPLTTFTGLTRIADPSPLQRWASTTKLPDGPLLVIVEDVTGAGKTEAAQMLVHRLMATGRASGAYWAMPTQATANAMYERQANAIDALFAPDDHRPSLALAHGQVRLHEGFRATVLAMNGGEVRDDDDVGGTATELTAGAACAAFFAEDRRAALLADVGAGTVDQALLGALPSKFNTVRLFGLGEKVLVVDEVHAYDAYMGVEIDELLRFQAALGGCAVVLSATLSLERREQIARSWRAMVERRRPAWAGEQSAAAPLAVHASYPLATVVTLGEERAREQPLEAAEWSRRSVDVRLVHELDAVVDRVVEAARSEAAVAWVRNSVDDCLAAAEMIRARGMAPLVFHARFAQCDRQARENEVLRLFGRDATPRQRSGRVLVATQVIEQSLDLDFDLLVSDLAPIDLLIQRAGRLWRHPVRDAMRPRGLARELVVLAPAPDAEPAPDWLHALLPRTARVYQNTGVLWRTARVLADAKAIVTPAGVRALIEAVYGRDAMKVPACLATATGRAEGKQRADAATANYAALKVSDGYDGNARAWMDELRAPTRLSDPTTVVRLARATPAGSITPWAHTDGPAWKRWALSEVRLAAWRVPPGAIADVPYRAAVDAARTEWGRYERDLPVLPLSSAGQGEWTGTLTKPEGGTVTVRYTAGEGVAYG